MWGGLWILNYSVIGIWTSLRWFIFLQHFSFICCIFFLFIDTYCSNYPQFFRVSIFSEVEFVVLQLCNFAPFGDAHLLPTHTHIQYTHTHAQIHTSSSGSMSALVFQLKARSEKITVGLHTNCSEPGRHQSPPHPLTVNCIHASCVCVCMCMCR